MPYVVFGALYLLVAFLLLVALGRAAKRRVPGRFEGDVVPVRNPLDDEEYMEISNSNLPSNNPENPFAERPRASAVPEAMTMQK